MLLLQVKQLTECTLQMLQLLLVKRPFGVQGTKDDINVVLVALSLGPACKKPDMV